MALCALADTRLERVKRAIQTGKHILAEKPIGRELHEEWEAVRLTEGTGLISTVNLYLHSAWYTKEIKDFIENEVYCEKTLGESRQKSVL